jgi:hypothetical protein
MEESQITAFDYLLISCILLIGGGVLIGIFRKMKDGFGRYNFESRFVDYHCNLHHPACCLHKTIGCYIGNTWRHH